MSGRLASLNRAAVRAAGRERPIGRTARRVLNLWRYRGGAIKSPLPAVRYLMLGRELTNFTYDIANFGELAMVVAGALNLPVADVESLIHEVRDDEEFKIGLRSRLCKRDDRETEPRLGAGSAGTALCGRYGPRWSWRPARTTVLERP